MSISCDIQKILRQVAAKESVEVLGTKFHEQNKKGEGFMGDLYYVTMKDEVNPLKKMEVVVKKATNHSNVRNTFPVSRIYGNECLFYDNIWPSFQDFQNRMAGENVFDKVPICFAVDTTAGHEKIVLENLKAKQFETLNKRDCFNKEDLEYVFEQYGKFHAVSMAFKAENAQLFFETSIKFYDYLSELSKIELVKNSTKHIIEKSMSYLKEERENEIVSKFEKYVEHASEIHATCTDYKGNNGVIIHGDCWSNNLMFKFNGNGKSRTIEDLRLIDFQCSRIGTPVYDLSYCLYSGGNEEIYNDLENYLQVYHNSLSETLKKFYCDPEVLYPYASLKREWKEYSPFGFIMGLLLLGAKLVEDGEDMTLSEILDRPGEAYGKCDEEETRKRALALIRHMYMNDFL